MRTALVPLLSFFLLLFLSLSMITDKKPSNVKRARQDVRVFLISSFEPLPFAFLSRFTFARENDEWEEGTLSLNHRFRIAENRTSLHGSHVSYV